MRILITTGIFEPETGGPATYAPKIATLLANDGFRKSVISVITYSDVEKYNFDSQYPFRIVRVVRTGSRLRNYWRFFRAVRREMEGVDLVYSLDWTAAGLPVVLAAFFKKIPIVIRVGGDYIWERYLQSGAEPLTLKEFNERGMYKNDRILYRIITFVLQRAFVVFNSDTQRNMYHEAYGLRPERTAVIYNPTPDSKSLEAKRESPNNEIVFAGRFIAMKNVVSLVRAFAKARVPYKLVLIGGGPEEQRIRNAIQELHIEGRVTILAAMPQKALFGRIKNSRVLVLPSWTDISPNEVNEAIALGIPMLVTKENYLSYRDQLPEMLDPGSVDDIRHKLEMLTDETQYDRFAEHFTRIVLKSGWDDVLQKHLQIFEAEAKFWTSDVQ